MPTSKENQPSKHPRKMTTAEAVEHLFHPEIVEYLRVSTAKPTKPLKKE